MEMILRMDEQNNKLQASVRMKLVNKFKHQLEEGSAVTLQCYSLGKMCVQNGYNGSKLFLHNGKESVINDDLNDIEEFRKSLVSKEGNENSENTISRISTASKHSTKDDFVKKFPFRTIAELLDVEQGMASIIVGTIIAIHEEEGWWYIGCRTCRKKVIKEIEIVDLETDMENKSKIGPDEWRCTKCNVDLESQTDENTTPTNALLNTAPNQIPLKSRKS
ncbi:replication protein A 70 kDa DNA-binding subunit B [Tanacetum coccineum]|uniref:Replication protein A 70 kDa DNA-binding subunit B n=1 Tax=Tanacetum coccineum TaxID=301880 RepID=A0ABQ5DXN0_9ASTR